jgi:copper(I)-binding protein
VERQARWSSRERNIHPVTVLEEAFDVIRRSGKIVANGLLIGALALLVPAAAGCEAGFNAPTLEFHPASGGAHADVNGISISNAFVLGAPSGSLVPAGSSVSMFLGMYNGGTSDDTLTGVTAQDYAASVTVTGGTVSLPASASVNLTGPQPSVVLTGLKKPLEGGESIPVTLQFEHAGPVTLQVPVEPQSFYYSTFSPPPPTPTASATPKATPTATATATATPSTTPTP